MTILPMERAARAAKPDDPCGACGVVRKRHGSDGRTKHWFVAAKHPERAPVPAVDKARSADFAVSPSSVSSDTANTCGAPSSQEEGPAPTEPLAHCNNCGGYMGRTDASVAPSELVDGACVTCAGVVLYRRNRTLEDRIVQGRAQNGRLMTRQSELTAALSTERRRAEALREAMQYVWDALDNDDIDEASEKADLWRVERPEADALDRSRFTPTASAVSTCTAKREAHADALTEAQVCDREEATRRAVRRYPLPSEAPRAP